MRKIATLRVKPGGLVFYISYSLARSAKSNSHKCDCVVGKAPGKKSVTCIRNTIKRSI